MEKIKRSKAGLERYLEEKAKDYRTLTRKAAQEVMSISTFQIWQSWRDLQDVVEGDLS